jgi:hypothetical protein
MAVLPLKSGLARTDAQVSTNRAHWLIVEWLPK